MAVSSSAFHWLEILEKEFDKALVDLSLLTSDPDIDENYLEEDARIKISILTSAFSQLAQKAQAIFENNAKLEAKNIALKDELIAALSEKEKLLLSHEQHNQQINSDTSIIMKKEIDILKKENDEMREYIVALQGEVYGARLAAKYLDKELAGRIQQIQLLSRRMDGPEHTRLWNTLEAEIKLQRHKTVMRACQGITRSPNDGSALSTLECDRQMNDLQRALNVPNLSQLHEGCLRRVTLHRGPQEGMGLSVTGGVEHGIPIMISDIHSDTPASRSGQLRVGDAILAVNGHDLRALQHSEAVNLLASVRGDVVLDVIFVYPQSDSEEKEEDNVLVTADSGQSYRLYDVRYQLKNGDQNALCPTALLSPPPSEVRLTGGELP